MQKIKHLEGLRGIAALIVLFGHLRAACFLEHQKYLYAYIKNLTIHDLFKFTLTNTIDVLFQANLSVWIFWVLSSYVISILFFKENENYDKVIIGYFSKRYLRLLFPVLSSVIFAYVLVKFGLMFNNRLAAQIEPQYPTEWLSSVYNFHPDIFLALKSAVFESFFNFQRSSSYNLSLWTIQSEFLGSLFTFSIFGIIRHNSRRFILYVIILLVILKLHLLWLAAFTFGHILCDFDFSNSKSKVLDFVRSTETRIHRFTVSIFILSLAFIIFGRYLMTRVNISLDYQTLILSVFIVYICNKNTQFQNFFSSKLPFFLGNISFSLYLIHLPILCSLTSFLLLRDFSLQGKIEASLLTIFVIIFVSYYFTKYIDRNSIVFANKIGDFFKRYS